MGKHIITSFMKNNKFTYIVGIVFMLLSSYIQTLFPRILGKTIDILKTNNFDEKLIKLNIIYILLIGASTLICSYIWRNLVIGNSRKLECHLRELLFDHMQKLPAHFYNKRKTGELIAYAINDVGAVRMTFGPAMAISINGIALCATSVYSMAQVINWKITLLSLVPIPFTIFFMIKIGAIIQIRFRKVQEGFATISDKVQESIYGIRVIKAYSQEKQENTNFEILNNEVMLRNINMVKVSSFLSPVIELCFSLSFVLNLIIGGNMVLNGSISLGDFIAFNTYLTIIMSPIISIGRVINIFQRGMASLKRLNEIFNVDTQPNLPSSEVNKITKGTVEFTNLNFSYPEALTNSLQGINLKIEKGESLGIIGKTGSGKSTLASALLRLYNVEHGRIFIDGIDINHYSLDVLRGTFGYVPQDNYLFSATIDDNIRFFKALYTKEQVYDAAKASCIYHSIMALPEGFETLLGERGVNLSGGEKQRISIARAIIKDPTILILDDSLSAVDTITSAKILNNLRSLREDKTTIIIAHRISTVKNADNIIVLAGGKIHEMGSHKELMLKEGLYYDIYREQSSEEKKEPGYEA